MPQTCVGSAGGSETLGLDKECHDRVLKKLIDYVAEAVGASIPESISMQNGSP